MWLGRVKGERVEGGDQVKELHVPYVQYASTKS